MKQLQQVVEKLEAAAAGDPARVLAGPNLAWLH